MHCPSVPVTVIITLLAFLASFFLHEKKKTTIKKKDVADLSTRSCLHAEAKWNMAAGHYRHAAASYCEPKFDKP